MYKTCFRVINRKYSEELRFFVLDIQLFRKPLEVEDSFSLQFFQKGKSTTRKSRFELKNKMIQKWRSTAIYKTMKITA